jgi:hypothetical protein
MRVFSPRWYFSLVASIAAALLIWSASGCGKSTSTTNVVGPSPSKCATSATNSTPEVPANGGGGTITVTAERECVWSARAQESWITLSGASGQGTSRLNYTVAANPNGAPRRGQVVVSDQTLEIVQRAAACRFQVAPTTLSVNTTGGEATVNITAPGGCSWRAQSDAPWITRVVPGEGAGSAAVRLSVAPNTGDVRRGTMTVAGRSITIEQAGTRTSCTYRLSPDTQSVGSDRQELAVTVTTESACAWTVSSEAGWITVATGATGTGTGSFRLAIGANSGDPRTGVVRVGDQTLTIQQAGQRRCTYAIKPTDYNAGRGPDDIRISVTSTSGCGWTATSPVGWVRVAEGASGSGNGTVRLLVSANNGAERAVDLPIAGETFRLRQNGCSTSIKPTSYRSGRGPDDVKISVTADSGCTWTATSTVSWVTIAEGQTGSGNGTVRLLIAPNSGEERSVKLDIAGHTFDLRQSGKR